MAISELARKRLAGQWGSYDFRLIRDRHHLNIPSMVENFLDHYRLQWSCSTHVLDQEIASNLPSVREYLASWAPGKLQQIMESEAETTLHESIMFKQLHYGNRQMISFGSIGTSWQSKSVIADELKRYRPWSVRHAASFHGGIDTLYQNFTQIVRRTNSPSELAFFDAWWHLSDNLDRPMLFPQVSGHTSGKFWLTTESKAVPIHFDFGMINCETRAKIIIECDSRRYHSQDDAYQRDRTRQNVAERLEWSVRRFTYQDVMLSLDKVFANLEPHILPYRGVLST